MRITSDGFEWLDEEMGRGFDGFCLTMVKGISHVDLAVRLGAEPGGLMSAETAREMLELSPGPWDLPELAMLGRTVDGWAFAIESPTASDHGYRLAPGRDLWSAHTVVRVSDSTMDPPVINVTVDGEPDWMFWEYRTDHTDHPLTRRLALGTGEVRMSDVYRAMGDHYGLSLPRQAITERLLPHAFTEPRVRVRALAACPVCGGRMIPHRGDPRKPDDLRLVCVFYKVRNADGHPPGGCPGEIRGAALAGAIHEEPNPKYANIRMPDEE
ncbi:hypothetical protein K4B79_02635 [Streptomyces lincolnensis]|uniref:hypothetical protein n=1 Tax=Streptomyces lincolnensis TaxID=1915 RepID=UPI001E29900D|nr:hypothetical protein [Streptomyces lincolnensis]MCD7437114.1 hypothetical protein [Streptomyces lincolnensis]